MKRTTRFGSESQCLGTSEDSSSETAIPENLLVLIAAARQIIEEAYRSGVKAGKREATQGTRLHQRRPPKM